jgi:hypothetical protein
MERTSRAGAISLNEQAQKYIGGELLRLVEAALDGV